MQQCGLQNPMLTQKLTIGIKVASALTANKIHLNTFNATFLGGTFPDLIHKTTRNLTRVKVDHIDHLKSGTQHLLDFRYLCVKI